jgi:glycosyltransferase involved in cell wall biosynthesis
MFFNRLLFNKYFKRGGALLLNRCNSSYEQMKQTAISKWRRTGMPDFDRLLTAISKGYSVNPDDLLPYLCMDLREDRLWVNVSLARAFHQAGDSQQAAIFMQRAWIFSGGAEEYLSLFVDVHAANGDVESIRDAYKDLGIRAADEKNIAKALKYFNAWQYAYSEHKKLDEYYYDIEVLDCISQLAEPHVFPLRELQPVTQRKVRLAYLVFGMTHLNSAIVKNCLTFAKYHDAALFDVTFYIPDQNTTIMERQEAVENIKAIEVIGWQVVTAPDSFSDVHSLIELSRSIYESNPDILITSAGLADFRHFFVAAMKPAPLVIGLCQGPPPQYIAPSFDWSISWTKHPMIDCPTNCSLVDGATVLPGRQLSVTEAKRIFGVPEDHLVLMSCGRLSKFQDQEIWISILDLLRNHSTVHYVVVGLDSAPSFLDCYLTQDVAERVRFIGRVKDFHSVLSMADVVVDTYPSGGGMTVVDTMALGIPIVAFKNNYMKPYSQTDWSPAEEFMGVPELLIGRGDFEQMNRLLSKLLTDHEYRNEMSKLCKDRIHQTYGDREKMIRDCEQVYLDVLKLNTSIATKAC